MARDDFEINVYRDGSRIYHHDPNSGSIVIDGYTDTPMSGSDGVPFTTMGELFDQGLLRVDKDGNIYGVG